MRTLLSRVAGTLVSYALVVPIWLGIVVGLVIVRGRDHVLPALLRGNVVLISNHPTLLETVAIPALFWHWNISGHKHRVPHSIADENFFGGTQWLQRSCRIIVVSREKAKTKAECNRTAVASASKILQAAGNVIYYPEGGRTCKGSKHVSDGQFRVRVCQVGFLRKMQNPTTTIVPVWIDHKNTSDTHSLLRSYQKLYCGRRLTITFGNPQAANAERLTSSAVATMLLAIPQHDTHRA